MSHSTAAESQHSFGMLMASLSAICSEFLSDLTLSSFLILKWALYCTKSSQELLFPERNRK